MYKPPIIKPKLSEHQQSMLNLMRLVKGEKLPLRQAAKEFYELRYPTGVQNHVCTQMRKKASHHKSMQNEGGNLKPEYFLHCIGSTDYIVEEWNCKKVRKQITKWNGTNTFVPTGEYEEYYNLYLKGYWLNEIPKKKYPLADLIPKHLRHIPGSEISHPGLHPKFRNEDGSQMTVEERKAKYVNWMTSDDWPNPKLFIYKVEESNWESHPFQVVYNGNPFLYELEEHANQFCEKLNNKTTLTPKQR